MGPRRQTMHREGPPLEPLLHRVAETPPEFLAEPRLEKGRRSARRGVPVPAVVGDLCRRLRLDPPPDALRRCGEGDRNRQSVALLLTWLLSAGWFRDAEPSLDEVLGLLCDGAAELAETTPSRKFLEDGERREELARVALARLGYRPLGETEAQARDRLTGLSAAERKRVMAAARKAEERARKIREELRRKAAQESADKWTRE